MAQTREARYQGELIPRIKRRFPGIVVVKNDPGYLQGFPDLLLLYMDKWAVLEVKASADSDVQPNQPYYIELLGEMSYAAFIYPENEEEILSELQFAFQPHRNTRVSQRL